MKKICIVAMLVVAATLQMYSQWTASQGIFSEEIHSIADKNGILFAGTSLGLYRSSDGGATWTTSPNNGLASVSVYSLAVQGTFLFAGTSQGVFRSSNDGLGWMPLTGPFSSEQCLAIGTDGSRLYVGSSSGSVYASTDNGSTWATSISLNQGIYRITVNGADVYASTWGGGPYRSTNSGMTWTRIGAGLQSDYVRDILSLSDSTILAATWNVNAAFRSSNKGGAWTKIEPATSGIANDWDIYAFVKHGKTIYATGYWAGVYWSDNDGMTWKYGGLSGILSRSIYAVGSKLYVGTDSNIVAIADTSFVKNYSPATLQFPADGAKKVSVNPTLAWTNNSYFPPFRQGHEIFLAPEPVNWDSAYRTGRILGNSHTLPGPLKYNTTYHWLAVDYTGQSDIHTFTTVSNVNLRVTYPNGGETLAAADTVNITWEGALPSDTVRLEYSTDDGMTWLPISDKANGLSHKWIVPSLESVQCLVRASYSFEEIAGTLDDSFQSGSGFDQGVQCAAMQPDGRMIFGGDFGRYQGFSANKLVRLHANGNIDTTFNVGAGFNGSVRSIAIQADGKIIAVGDFTEFQSYPRNRIVRLNSNGSIDTTYDVGDGFNLSAHAVDLQSDGRAIVIGAFNIYRGNSHNRIARINTDGSGDYWGFQSGSGFDRDPTSMIVQGDQIVVGGLCTNYNGVRRGFLFRINKDGDLDEFFNVGDGFNGWTDIRHIDENGRIYACGQFGNVHGINNRFIARLHPDGSLDTTFTSRADTPHGQGGGNSAVSFQNGRILTTATIHSYDGIPGNTHLLYPNGRAVAGFASGVGFNDRAFYIKQTEQTAVAFGYFSQYNGVAAYRIARIHIEDGNVSQDVSDAEFTIGIPRGSADSLDFGDVEDGKSLTRAIKVRNTGVVPLALVDVVQPTSDQFFQIVFLQTLTIPVGDSTTFLLDFVPTKVGAVSDSVGFVTRARDTIYAAISGNGTSSIPNVSITADPAAYSVCFGRDTIIAAKAANGVKPYKFFWTLEDGSPIPSNELKSQSIDGDSIHILSLQSRQFKVVVVDSVNGRDSAVVTFTTVPLPTPAIVGSISVCANQHGVGYMSAGVPGSTYAWDIVSGSATIVSANMYMVELNFGAAGTSILRLRETNSSGCSKDTTLTISVGAGLQPVIASLSGRFAFCSGSDVTLDAGISGAVYQWKKDGADISGATTKTYTATTAGSYSVSATLGACSGVSASQAVSETPLPTPTITQSGGTLQTESADKYQWLDAAGQPIVGAVNQSYAPPASGSYSVLVVKDSCAGQSSNYTFTLPNPSVLIVRDLEFGSLPVHDLINGNGGHARATHIVNTGNQPQIIAVTTTDNNAFTVLGHEDIPIPANDSVRITVRFVPSQNQTYNGRLQVQTQSGIQANGALEGIGRDLAGNESVSAVQLEPGAIEVNPGDTLRIFLRLRAEAPRPVQAKEFRAFFEYDPKVLSPIGAPLTWQLTEVGQVEKRYWGVSISRTGFRGVPRLNGADGIIYEMLFIAKLADVDSTRLIFTGENPFEWLGSGEISYVACRDSVVRVRICTEGGVKRLITRSPGTKILTTSPNPNHGDVEVTYSLGERGPAEVYITDVYGRRVHNISAGTQDIGIHSAAFNTSEWSDGAYMFVIQTNYARVTGKIIVAK